MHTAAAAPDQDAASRPATWDMTPQQLEAVGLGQSRGVPRPVPDDYPRLNVGQDPSHGGIPPWIIFVNFDGATLTGGMDSSPDNVTQIMELAGEFAPYGDAPEQRAAIVQATALDWAPYNIEVVDVRPATGDYTMNMTGPTNPFGGGVLGIAPVDCDNAQTHNNITYAFHSADDGFSAATAATTVGQEVAHSYGLEHVDEPADILNPTNQGGDPSFLDECLPLSPGGVICQGQHVAQCPDGASQNSHLELLALFGPSIPDLEGPIVSITAPLTGTMYNEGDGFNVIAQITDDSDIDVAELYSDGQLLTTDTMEPWGWNVASLPPGIHLLEVVAYDEHGNQGLSTGISVLMGGEPVAATGDGPVDGSGTGIIPGGTVSDTDPNSGSGGNGGLMPGNDSGCGCTEGGPASPGLALGPLLLLLGLRRRHRR